MEPLQSTLFGPNEDVTCEDRVLTWITVYTTGWVLIFFGVAYPWLMKPPPLDAANGGGGGEAEAEERPPSSCTTTITSFLSNIANPNMIGSFIGVAAGAITPFQTALFNGRMVWLSSAMVTLGTPTIGLSALIVGTTLGQTVYRLWVSFRKGGEGSRFGLKGSVEKGPDDGGAAVNILDNDDLIEEKFGVGEFGDDAATTDGATRNDRGIIPIEDEDKAPDELPLPSITVILALVVTKMVLCPMAGIAMIYFLADVVIRDADVLDTQLIKLVLILEAAVPSADFVIVTCA
jgi:hypothetical protein